MDEVTGCAASNRHYLGSGLAKRAGKPLCGNRCDFWIQHNIEICIAQACHVGSCGTQWRNDIDVNAQLTQQSRDFAQVVPMAKTQRGRAKDIAAFTTVRRALGFWFGQRAYQLVKSL